MFGILRVIRVYFYQLFFWSPCIMLCKIRCNQMHPHYVVQWRARLPIHTLKYMDRAVSGARFLTGGVFECDIAHRRSVPILCMLYIIRSGVPVHPLNAWCSTCIVCASVGYTRCSGRESVYLCAPRTRLSQYFSTFILLSVSLRDDLADPVFDSVGLVGFKSKANAFYWLKLLYPFFLLFSISLLSVYRMVLLAGGLWIDRV